MIKNEQVVGYLPDEHPQFWKLLLYAIQQVIVMFPATVAVAIITGFHISTTIFASGLATLCLSSLREENTPLLWFQLFLYCSNWKPYGLRSIGRLCTER